MTVLDLLCDSWNDRTDRTIERWPHAPPHVQVDSFCGEYDRHSGTTRYLVAPEVADRMVGMRWVEGTKKWGYTEGRELRVTERGREHLWEERSRLGEFPRASCWLRRRSSPKGSKDT